MRIKHSVLKAVFGFALFSPVIVSRVAAQTNAPIPPEGDLTKPYRVEMVASRLQAPWSVVLAPDGRIFFSERPGWVRAIIGAGFRRSRCWC